MNVQYNNRDVLENKKSIKPISERLLVFRRIRLIVIPMFVGIGQSVLNPTAPLNLYTGGGPVYGKKKKPRYTPTIKSSGRGYKIAA